MMGGISLGFVKTLFFSRFAGGSFLVLDIGTFSVKLLCVERKDKNVRIEGGVSKPYISEIYTEDGLNSDVILSTCRKALKELSANLKKSLPKKVILGVGGGFLHGSTSTQNYIRDNASVEIDTGEFANIIQKVQQRIYEQIRRDFSRETARSELEVYLINAGISDIKIDGYQIVNPMGFKGKEVTVSLFNSYASKSNIEIFEKLVVGLHLELISMISEPYAVFNTVYEDDQSDAIFIDMGGGVTEVTLTRKGKLEDTKAIAMGGLSFTKSISESLKISHNEAENIKQMVSLGNVSDRVSRKINSIITKDVKFFLGALQVVLHDLSQVLILPPQIYLYGGGATIPIVQRMLSQKRWTEKLSFFSRPKVNKLVISKDKIDYASSELKDILWTTPASLANFYTQNYKDDDISKILKRTLRLIQQR